MAIIRCGGMSYKRFNVIEDVDYIEPLSRGDFAAFHDYVSEMNSRLNRGFQLRISPQHCEPGCVAEVDTDFNYRRIVIALCPHFHMFDPEQKRTIITHELCHPIASCLKMPYDALEDIVSQDVWTTVASTAMAMEEHMVTSLEWALAGSQPLPPTIGKAKKTKKR